MKTYFNVLALFVRVFLGIGLLGSSFLSNSEFSKVYFFLGLLFLDGAYREWRVWKLEDALLARNQTNVQENSRT